MANAQISIKNLYHCLYNICSDKNAITNYKNKAEKLEKSLKQKYIENFEIKIRTAQESIDLEDLDYAQKCIEDINSKLYEDKKYFLSGEIYEGTDLKKYLEGPIRKNYENKIKILKKNLKNKIKKNLEKNIEEAQKAININDFSVAEINLKNICKNLKLAPKIYLEDSNIEIYKNKKEEIEENLKKKIIEYTKVKIKEAHNYIIHYEDLDSAEENIKNIRSFLENYGRRYLNYQELASFEKMVKNINENIEKGKREERRDIVIVVNEYFNEIEHYIKENNLDYATSKIAELNKYVDYGTYNETKILIKQFLIPEEIKNIKTTINEYNNLIKKRRKEKTIDNLKDNYRKAINKINNQNFKEASDIVTEMISEEEFLLPFDKELEELYKDIYQLKNIIENKEKYISAKKQLKNIYEDVERAFQNNFELLKQKIGVMKQELKTSKQYLRNDEIKEFENQIMCFDTIIESHDEEIGIEARGKKMN